MNADLISIHHIDLSAGGYTQAVLIPNLWGLIQPALTSMKNGQWRLGRRTQLTVYRVATINPTLPITDTYINEDAAVLLFLITD